MTRNRPDLVWYVTFLHLAWGFILITFDPIPTLRVAFLASILGGTTPAGWLYFTSAVMAASSAFYASAPWRLVMLIPQQSILLTSAFTGAYYTAMGSHPYYPEARSDTMALPATAAVILAFMHLAVILKRCGTKEWLQTRYRSLRSSFP